MNLPAPVNGNKVSHSSANMDSTPRMPLHGDKKSLAIALIVASVFLLAAVGVAVWLFVQKSGGNSVITQLDPNSTTNVTGVSWVPPVLPGGYVKYDQSTTDASVVYYANNSEGCAATTRVVVVGDTSDLAKVAATANDTAGVVTKTLAGEGSLGVTYGDSDDKKQYDFNGVEFDQTVSVPTLDYNAQSGVVYYKMFGNHLASISFVCKLATFQSNTDVLDAFIKKFTVKTER